MVVRVFKFLLPGLVAGLLAMPAAALNLEERADALMLDMLGLISSVRDYEARFVVQTREAGRMRPPEAVYIKQRRSPSCIHTRWLDGPRKNAERVFCSEESADNVTVRSRARTLMNQKQLSRAQLTALQVVLRPVDDDGLYGMVARYANQYFDAAESVRQGDYKVEVRHATVYERPVICLRLRRKHAVADAHYQGQTELCVDVKNKLPSAFRAWDARGELLESYLIGDYRINSGLQDSDFELESAN